MNRDSDSPYDGLRQPLNGGDDEDIHQQRKDKWRTKLEPIDTCKEPARPHSRLWIITGILSGVFFGLGNSIMGKTSYYQFYSQEIILVGTMIVGLLYYLVLSIISRSQKGYYWRWEESNFNDSAYQRINWIYIAVLLTDAVLMFFKGILILTAFKYALYADLNQGIITTLFAITGIYLAILFWLIYGERMTIFEIIGMILLITCAILIIFSEREIEGGVVVVNYNIVDKISPLWSVLLAVVVTLVFTIKSLLIKYTYSTLKIDSSDLVIWSYIIAGFASLLLILQNLLENGVDLWFFLQNLVAGIFEVLGNIWVAHSLVTGVAGAASALPNTQILLQIMLDAFVFGQIPNVIQIIACVIGVIGALTISSGMFIWKNIKEWI